MGLSRRWLLHVGSPALSLLGLIDRTVKVAAALISLMVRSEAVVCNHRVGTIGLFSRIRMDYHQIQ